MDQTINTNEDSNPSLAESVSHSDTTNLESFESIPEEQTIDEEDVTIFEDSIDQVIEDGSETLPEESSETTLLDDASNTEPAAPISSRRETYNRNAYIMLDVNHKKVEPVTVVEYEWPPKSGDRWFLQEQIGELLDIKSFSRKFPDLTRRKVNHEEREFLETVHNVHKLLNETQLRDMNAMRSAEIHDLMNAEYPDIYQEYKKIVSQREREIALEKAREMEAIKNDSVKLAELRRQALKSAADFNKDLQNSRKTERKQFWDIQTNVIQSRLSKWKKLSKEATKPHPYPVALIPGQYQHYFKEYTEQELMRLPVSTVMETSSLYAPRRNISPVRMNAAEQDKERLEKAEALAKSRSETGAVNGGNGENKSVLRSLNHRLLRKRHNSIESDGEDDDSENEHYAD